MCNLNRERGITCQTVEDVFKVVGGGVEIQEKSSQGIARNHEWADH